MLNDTRVCPELQVSVWGVEASDCLCISSCWVQLYRASSVAVWDVRSWENIDGSCVWIVLLNHCLCVLHKMSFLGESQVDLDLPKSSVFVDLKGQRPHWAQSNLLAFYTAGIALSQWQQTSAHRSGSSTCRVSSTRRHGRSSTRGRTSPSSRRCSSLPSMGNAWGRPWTAKPSTTTPLSSDIWR